MHHLLEANSWFLLLQDSIIEQYYVSKDKPEIFTNIYVCRPSVTVVVVKVNGDGLFPQSPPHKYTLVVISKMGNIPIHRQKPPAAKVDSSNGKAKKQVRLHSKPTYYIHLLNFTRSSRTSILASCSTTLGARFSITLLQSMT